MNRRNFIKSFGAVAASIPVVTALADIKGTEKVIETFNMEDVQREFMDSQSVASYNKEVIFESTPQYKTNPYRDKYGNNILNNSFATILVLAYDYKSYLHFIKNTSYDITPGNSNYINRRDNLLGCKRGIEMIGLYKWWETTSNEIKDVIYQREMIVLNPNQYFKGQY